MNFLGVYWLTTSVFGGMYGIYLSRKLKSWVGKGVTIFSFTTFGFALPVAMVFFTPPEKKELSFDEKDCESKV